MRNFDLNIYDRLAYETSGEETGEWAVVAVLDGKQDGFYYEEVREWLTSKSL